MRSDVHKVLNHFLEEVDEQIGYQPMHAAINEELRAHIEDKAHVYMEYGVEEEEAYEKAVRDMGDASALGIEMHEAHHLRTAKPLLLLLLILIVLGMLGNLVVRGFSVGELFYNGYFIWGFFVLFLTMMYGYPCLLKYAGKLTLLFLIMSAFFVVSRMVARSMGVNHLPFDMSVIYSPSTFFGILQLAVPTVAILLYRRRQKGLGALLLLTGLQFLFIWFSRYAFLLDYACIPFMTVLFTSFGLELYVVEKKYLNIEKKKGILVAAASFLVVFCVWSFGEGERLSHNLELFLHPETQADNAWMDGYNNVLIRHLLGRAEWFGEVDLSEEEMIRYGTSQWYYEDGPGEWDVNGRSLEHHITYRMQFLEEPKLSDILPQHFLNNYRIAWWILKYGWIPGISLTLLLIVAYGILLMTAFRIRNRLGSLTALAGSLALGIQFLFYLMGNFGYQFGMFGNLPFVSEGLVSITGSALMAGLVLSAYRFDTVVTEKE